MPLTELINAFNAKYSELGQFELYTWNRFVQSQQEIPEAQLKEEQGIKCEVSDVDLVLVYDFSDDVLSDEEREVFAQDYYAFWDKVRELTATLPQLVDNDGSGGGLYYGICIYKCI